MPVSTLGLLNFKKVTDKLLMKRIITEKITFIIGVVVTLIFSVTSLFYFKFRNDSEFKKTGQSFFQAIEALDLRFTDFKYKIRGSTQSDAPVALIAVDDDSVLEIGRWPWSRQLVGDMTQKLTQYGVKSVAFDMIFSEPEVTAPQADAHFGNVVSQASNQVILGVFSDDLYDFKPHQDYCVTEAFRKTGGEEIVKFTNTTFVVDDPQEDFFDQLDWSSYFEANFTQVLSKVQHGILTDLGKSQVDGLNQYQKNYLHLSQSKALFDFCRKWNPDELFVQFVKATPQGQSLSQMSSQDIIKKLTLEMSTHLVPSYGGWTSNVSEIQNPSTYTASFIAQQDTDGYVRRYPLFYRSGKKVGTSYIPSLSLQSYLLNKGYRAEISIESSDNFNHLKKISSFKIVDPSQDPAIKIMDVPVDSKGQLIVNYYGQQMSLPYISAKEFFNEKTTMKVKRSYSAKADASLNGVAIGHGVQIKSEEVNKADFLKNRSVIVGATAVGIYDLRSIPIEANYPGPEIHLTVLANLLDQSFLKIWKGESFWLPILMIVFGVFLSWIWSILGPVSSMVLVISGLVLMGIADYVIFLKLKYVTSSLLVLMQMGSIYFSITIFKYFTEEKKKREMKSMFSKYVSPAIVDELLQHPERLKLGGRKQRMTAFFSDVRGFTTISEKLPPEDLAKLLNRYLTPMTDIVFLNKGTLDKYMGDAIMAFFGAPIYFNDHARAACQCALDSLKKLTELQKQLAAEGLPEIDIGIGINTGDMNVGNMGSNVVQNYTVMGDSVNLASRLEGINKEYGTRIIISEYTYEEVKDFFVLREVDRVKVKGKTEPVRIYELIQAEPMTSSQKEHLEFYQLGYRSYYDKKFVEAKNYFLKALELKIDDSVSKIYIKRCHEYLENPPPMEWDGVYVMKVK